MPEAAPGAWERPVVVHCIASIDALVRRGQPTIPSHYKPRSYAPLFWVLSEIATIARVATLLGGLVHRASLSAVSVGAQKLLQRTSENATSTHSGELTLGT
jgi:hypothetical protein